MTASARICFAALAATVLTIAQGAEVNRVRTHPHSSSALSDSGSLQLIVKLRAPQPAPSAASTQSAVARVQALAVRSQLLLEREQSITTLLHLMRVDLPAGASAEQLTAAALARLRADPEVEYAVPDQRRYIHALTPNDPLYTQQWTLQSAASTPSAIDATSAWSTSTGASGLVIADIDTGVRSDHPDLGSRVLPGRCFISDSWVANGGNCPGAGADDPGDWVTNADLSEPECSGESAGPSSWHGTRVAGIIGALTDNSTGVAGVTWSAQILPVRALGKCGGRDSDIITAMLWAAGIPVSGAPPNLTPAKIINLSLGGSGSCPQSYQDAINQVVAQGVLLVASAGNEGGPVDAPANCQGVAAIAGLRQAGTKVGYSNLGPQLALAAPAGNCVNTGAEQPCVYTITTATNLGATTPDANDYTGQYYCDQSTGSYPNCTLSGSNQYRSYNVGTSFSAPLVSGIAALMSSVNGNLNSCQLITRMKQTALPFPQTSSTSSTLCHVPTGSNDIQNSECICSNDGQTCGAGMANAAAALAAALHPVAAVSLPSSVAANQAITLDASGSKPANNATINSYAWTNVSGAGLQIQSASSAKASVTAPSCRISTVRLTVTDNAGLSDSADVVITPTSATTAAPAMASGAGSCTLAAPAVQVQVCPSATSLAAGAVATPFTADVANSSNASVSWQVNGIAGGDATVGTVSSAGEYTPPSTVPSPSTVTVTAVSGANSAVSSSSAVTITTPPAAGHSGGGALDWLSLSLAALYTGRCVRQRWRQSRSPAQTPSIAGGRCAVPTRN